MKILEQWIKEDLNELKKIDKKEYFSETFFRDPLRPQFVDYKYFYAPADGTILYAKQVKADEEIVEIKGKNFTLKHLIGDNDFNQDAIVIGIFMTMCDVHINRVPYGGMITYKRLDPITTSNKPMLSQEFDIFDGDPKSEHLDYLFENERMLNIISVPKLKYKYYVIQIADSEVDVIAHFIKQNKIMQQNEKFSLVRNGSQVDLILPLPFPKGKQFKIIVPEKVHIEAGLDKLIEVVNE